MLDKTPQLLLAGFSFLQYSTAYLLRPFLSSQELMGLPKFLNTSLSACHGLKTPADLHILAITDVLVLPSVNLKPLGIRLLGHLEAVPALQGTQLPLRPTEYSVYALPIWLFALPCSSMDTRLDTGG